MQLIGGAICRGKKSADVAKDCLEAIVLRWQITLFANPFEINATCLIRIDIRPTDSATYRVTRQIETRRIISQRIMFYLLLIWWIWPMWIAIPIKGIKCNVSSIYFGHLYTYS